MAKAQWIEVTRSRPCPICAHKGWCRISANGTSVHCHRAESNRPWGGPTGGGWLHELNGQQIVSPPPKRKPPPVMRNWLAEARRCYQAKAAVEMRAWLCKQLSIPIETLEVFRVGWGWDEYRNCDFSTWPERDCRYRIVGIARRYRDGTKRTMRGSRRGLYYVPDWDSKREIIIPEGGSDTAWLWTFGLSAIGRPSNVGHTYLPQLLRNHRKKRIVVLGENDRKPDAGCRDGCKCCALCWPGRYGALTVAQALADALGITVEWALPDGVKDARGLVSLFPEPPERIRGIDSIPLAEIGEVRAHG